MKTSFKFPLSAVVLATVSIASFQARAQERAAIAAPDTAIVGTIHAEGGQLYECKQDTGSASPPQAGALSWKFREPIATLIADGKTIGRHYAGPNWDYVDGSGVKAKVGASAPGTSAEDIPWLKLEVTERRGNGLLADVAIVQRINTKGGVLKGTCEAEGNYRIVPYSADYVFLRNNDPAEYTSSLGKTR
ncbi:MAG: DUF3455 domain-containing protein [Bradyrhizobium sp.]|jgi:hypothetical protein|nr:DUF3455 domain-containing protein [Bradyrhizobium sp.]